MYYNDWNTKKAKFNQLYNYLFIYHSKIWNLKILRK